MPRIVFSEAEQGAMRGLPHAAIALYFWLRARMDFKTALVGARQGAGISWRALYEDLYVEPHAGPVDRWPHAGAGIEKTRRTAAWLVRAGLVQLRSDRNALRLIFFLPFAWTYSHAQNKPDSIPTDDSDRPSPLGPSTGTRLTARQRSRQTSEVRESSTNQRQRPRYIAADSLAFPQALSQRDREAVIEIAAQARLSREDVQLVLDELREAMKRRRVERPTGLFLSMVKQLKAGEFYGAGAREARAGGKALSREEAQLLNHQRR